MRRRAPQQLRRALWLWMLVVFASADEDAASDGVASEPGLCALGECDYMDINTVCCTLGGERLTGDERFNLLGAKRRHRTRRLEAAADPHPARSPGGTTTRGRRLRPRATLVEGTSSVSRALEVVDNTTMIERWGTLCECGNGRHPTRGSFGSSMIIVSIFFLAGLLSFLLLYFRRTMMAPQNGENAADETGGAAGPPSAEDVANAYREAVERSKAALVDAEPTFDDDDEERCAICLEVMRGAGSADDDDDDDTSRETTTENGQKSVPSSSKKPLARPPGCDHVYHRACLEAWIDHVKLPKAADLENVARAARWDPDRPETTSRMFGCPMCGKTILPSETGKGREDVPAEARSADAAEPAENGGRREGDDEPEGAAAAAAASATASASEDDDDDGPPV